MINWKNFIAAMGVLAILPLAANATQFHSEVNTIEEVSNMSQISQAVKHRKNGDRGQGMNRLLEKLDLSAEQSQQIETIREQSKASAQALHKQMKVQRQEMKSLFTSDVDNEQIREQYQATKELRQQLGDNRFETMLQIREVLTAEQRAKMAELREQNRGHRGKFF